MDTRHRFKTRGVIVARISALALSLSAAGLAAAHAGEPVATIKPESEGITRQIRLAPAVYVTVHTLEPELFPAATELEDRLLYHLGHLPHLFWPALAGPAAKDVAASAGFVLDVKLDPLPDYSVRVLTSRPPFVKTVEVRALFSSQVPLRAQITASEPGSGRVVARTVLIVQSTGFTITAGTTKPAADLMAEKIVHYLKTQRSRGSFLDKRVANQ